MTNRITQMAGVAALSLAAAASAFADIKLNDNFSVGGYIVGSARYTKNTPKTGAALSTSTMDGDAYKYWANVTFAPVTATLSYYAGGSGDPQVLDAYATYDVGGGTKITFGKFLSWMGYEAFDPVNMTQISYGWDAGADFAYSTPNIPGYHSGVKVETGNDSFTAGFAVLDSVDPVFLKGVPSKGDGDLKNGPGFEAMFTYKGVKDLTLFAGLTYEPNTAIDTTISSVDLWAQYVLGATTFAAEYSIRKNDVKGAPVDPTISFWLVEVQQALGSKFAITARVSGVSSDDKVSATQDPSATKLTIAPGVTLTPNLSLLAEVSVSKYKEVALDKSTFVGLQARFKF
jgi:Putative beta-barrel porin-2, OmpL-like. bbp2